jgi:hypothetical protein
LKPIEIPFLLTFEKGVLQIKICKSEFWVTKKSECKKLKIKWVSTFYILTFWMHRVKLLWHLYVQFVLVFLIKFLFFQELHNFRACWKVETWLSDSGWMSEFG